MTEKEAAKHLLTYSTTMGSGQTTDAQHNEAKRLGIKALEILPKYKDAYGKGWEDGAKATYEHMKMCEEEQEQKTEQFAKWVAEEIIDEENWKYNADAFPEIACRKLHKLGIMNTDGKRWIYENEALEREPCEDCISRQAVLDKIKEVCFSSEQKWIDFRVSQGSNGQRNFIIKFIESLPPVNPQEPKTGHWIYICNSEVNGLKIVKCSECRKRTYGSGKYCPNCGAKMSEIPTGSGSEGMI